MIKPDANDILKSAIQTLEDDIAPTVSDEYAASLLRTVSQMLRSARARVRLEQATLDVDNRELRQLLGSVDTDRLSERTRGLIAASVPTVPEPRYPGLPELQEDALRLRKALAAVIGEIEAADDPVRAAGRGYLERNLAREAQWQQDAFTGPRR